MKIREKFAAENLHKSNGNLNGSYPAAFTSEYQQTSVDDVKNK
jgi:hypothetical protein